MGVLSVNKDGLHWRVCRYKLSLKKLYAQQRSHFFSEIKAYLCCQILKLKMSYWLNKQEKYLVQEQLVEESVIKLSQASGPVIWFDLSLPWSPWNIIVCPRTKREITETFYLSNFFFLECLQAKGDSLLPVLSPCMSGVTDTGSIR